MHIPNSFFFAGQHPFQEKGRVINLKSKKRQFSEPSTPEKRQEEEGAKVLGDVKKRQEEAEARVLENVVERSFSQKKRQDDSKLILQDLFTSDC